MSGAGVDYPAFMIIRLDAACIGKTEHGSVFFHMPCLYLSRMENHLWDSLLKKPQMLGARQEAAEAYAIYTPHKASRRATTQMRLFQQTAYTFPRPNGG